jgi:hypothetical protein
MRLRDEGTRIIQICALPLAAPGRSDLRHNGGYVSAAVQPIGNAL